MREIAGAATLSNSLLSQWRAGTRPITLDALSKLLPVIESHSNRAEALTILIAYLQDETPEPYAAAVRIYAVDLDHGGISKDSLKLLAERWEKRARADAPFAEMWQGMDSYMNGTIDQAEPASAIEQINVRTPARASDLTLNEPPADYAIVHLDGFTSDEANLIKAAAEKERQASQPGADDSSARTSRKPTPPPQMILLARLRARRRAFSALSGKSSPWSSIQVSGTSNMIDG